MSPMKNETTSPQMKSMAEVKETPMGNVDQDSLLEKANNAIENLRNEHVVELRGFNTVNHKITMVAKVLCLMFENSPQVKKSTPKEDAYQMYW